MHEDYAEPRLLLIESDPARRLVVTRLLILAGYTVDEVTTAEQALVQIDHRRPQLILLSPRITSVSTCRMLIFWAHHQRPSIPVILLLAPGFETAGATPLDGDDWISFPFMYDRLIAAIQRMI